MPTSLRGVLSRFVDFVDNPNLKVLILGAYCDLVTFQDR
jgi:hypothetical protein